ncbi:MAG TPA: tetratricopeptide repeat protein [Blastocatellia bacterium]|nr:tetratricopeptide repeat protein [Blastocatellia bacterium]
MKAVIVCLMAGIMMGAAAASAAAGAPLPGAAGLQARNSIGGHVFNENRRPLDRIRVELLDETDSVLKSVLTDSTGRYVFNNLSSGTFQVRVLTHGTNYVGETVRVNIINFSLGSDSGGGRTTSGGQYEQVNFTLKLDKRAAASSPGAPASTFVQAVPDNARTAFEKAVQDLNNESTAEQGIAGLKEAINLFPTYYMALERLGLEYVKRKQYEPAREALTKAVEVNPKGHLSLYGLGYAQYYLKQYAEAIDSLRRSISLNPTSAFSHLMLGIALLREKQLQDGETHLKKAIELGGKEVADAHMHLAQMYANAKRYKEAADELEMFLKKAPEARDAENIKTIIKQLRAKA